jgi:histone H3/H4
MDKQFIHQYFEKATALVLAAAGVESVEKQALHLLAGEAERYAKALGSNAAKIAESARRSECTAADIEAAAALLNRERSEEYTGQISIPAEMKKRLRLSVELKPVIDRPVEAIVSLPQLSPDSVEALSMRDDSGLSSPSRGSAKRLQAFPEWLQHEIESKLQALNSRNGDRESSENPPRSEVSEPLSYISSLVLAEEEARHILTGKMRTETSGSPLRRPV